MEEFVDFPPRRTNKAGTIIPRISFGGVARARSLVPAMPGNKHDSASGGVLFKKIVKNWLFQQIITTE